MIFSVLFLCIIVTIEGLALIVLFSRYNILKNGVIDFSEALKDFSELFKSNFDGVGQTLGHLYMLIDTLSGVLPPGYGQQFYMQLRNHPEWTADEMMDAKRKWTAEYFNHIRTGLTSKLAEIIEPSKKERLQRAITSIDDIWNLVNSVDENSSPEHRSHIQAEMTRVMFDLIRNPPLDPEDLGQSPPL